MANGKNGRVAAFNSDCAALDLKLNCGGKAFGVDASPWIVDARILVATRRNCNTSRRVEPSYVAMDMCYEPRIKKNIVIFYTSLCIVVGICIFCV